MPELIFKINNEDCAALGSIRCLPGLSIAVDSNSIWLKGVYDLSTMDNRLKQLPVKNIYIVDEQNNLFLPGSLTPVEILQQMHWQPLPAFIKVTLPSSALPGKTNELLKIKLIRSAKMNEGSALLTNLSVWKTYAETAPAVRLSSLKFALSENNEVLIMGQPLPSLPGREYWMTNNLLLPCGYDFEIPLVAEFMNKKGNAANDKIIIFNEDGTWHKIEKTFFVEAKRSAVRLTKEVDQPGEK